MFKFRPNVVLRFNLLVVFFFTLAGIIIIGKAAIIMFIERDDWNRIKEKNFKRNVPIYPHRGNILADNGDLIVSTLPQYRLKFDFKYINKDDRENERIMNAKRDSVYNKHLKELCVGLNDILPGTSVAELEKRFRDGLAKKKGGYEPYKGNVSYSQYKKIKELPIINLGKNYSGCYTTDNIERKNIFGDTGNSTFGIVRTAEIKGKKVDEVNGIERKYNEFLKGQEGEGTRIKMRGKYILREDIAPQNGYDIQTTLNTRMLDICHNALERVLKEKGLGAGWAILMETKTGDIKAIVNLSRIVRKDGTVEYIDTIGRIPRFNETPNHALCDLNEPGSIFKTVAMTAILADGKLTTKDSVIAYRDKQHKFSGASKPIKDEVYRDNGTGKYSMKDALMYSSNISMIQYIRMAYENNPEEYTNTLQKFGFTRNYNITDDEKTPKIKLPSTRGEKNGWDGFSLSSMSYGYAVQIPAINMVTFYNTIANGGKYMHPRLVKSIQRDGFTIEKYPTRVIDEQLFPKAVADTITSMLVEVVNGISIEKFDKRRIGKRDGTGKNARSELMTIAGKTGTAKAYGNKNKLLSFCGFFPAEAPEYTLIVQMMYDYDADPRPKEIKDGSGYGGGSTSALAFKEIAEKVMAEKLASPIENAIDETRKSEPAIKSGNMKEVNYLLTEMGIESDGVQSEMSGSWGDVALNNGKLHTTEKKYDHKHIPNVRGMGAKNAVYLLQKSGYHVLLDGYGTVKEQTIMAKDTIKLRLRQ